MMLRTNNVSAGQVLHQYFGYSSFRHGQEEIITSFLEGHDTMVVIPTGGGKSLCYQIPALMCDGTALVISPLIALMKDQVDALQRITIPATFINSSLHFREMQERMNNARQGAYKLLYLAPERLESRQFVEQLARIPLSFLAVDEAHCISEWGHDFRPSYQSIPQAMESLQRLPIIALTATATADVRTDIQRSLHMKQAHVFVRGFDRPNLRYRTEQTQSKFQRLQTMLSPHDTGSTIIYCGSRRRVEEVSSSLNQHGFSCASYHAGMHEIQRSEVQEKFISGERPLLCATSAFGMGVDKPDVRRVIHCDLTLTLEGYYQEAGRAGRDGAESDCTILYQSGDRGLQEFFIRSTYPAVDAIASVYTFLYDTLGAGRGQKPLNALFMDDVAIANRLNMSSPTVSGVLNLMEREDLIRRGSQQNNATLQLTAEADRLREYFHQTTPERREVLEALLRGVGSEALRNTVTLDLHKLVHKHDIPYDQFHSAIRAFEYARLMRYVPAAAHGGIALLKERLPLEALPLDLQALAERRDRAFKKLDVVQRYVETHECKRNFLLQYFDDAEHSERCGRCSSCLNVTPKRVKKTAEQLFVQNAIVRCVYELRERFGRTTIANILCGISTPKSLAFGLEQSESFGLLKNLTSREVVEYVDEAVRSQLLSLSPDLYPVLRIQPAGRTLIEKDLPTPLTIRYTPKESPVDDALLKKLIRIRKEIATRDETPPFSILGDEQLRQIAIQQPRTLDDFYSIKGVKHVFVNRYAAEFLHALNAERASEVREKQQTQLSQSALSTIAMLREGSSPHDVADIRGLSLGTIAAHVQEALECGMELSRQSLVHDDVYNAVRIVLKRNPRAFLKELRAELGGTHDVADLRIAAAFARRELRS